MHAWLKRVFLMAFVALLVSSPKVVSAYTRIESDGYQSSPITAYYGPDPEETGNWACRSKYTQSGDKNCYGAGGQVLLVGDVAVHMMDNKWNDPVAKFGTVVTMPSEVPLTRADGTDRISRQFIVRDTGTGPGLGNAWIDIYCGDAWSKSVTYNDWVNLNIWVVRDQFRDSSYQVWFNVQ